MRKKQLNRIEKMLDAIMEHLGLSDQMEVINRTVTPDPPKLPPGKS